jgi:hypothetical protein
VIGYGSGIGLGMIGGKHDDLLGAALLVLRVASGSASAREAASRHARHDQF